MTREEILSLPEWPDVHVDTCVNEKKLIEFRVKTSVRIKRHRYSYKVPVSVDVKKGGWVEGWVYKGITETARAVELIRRHYEVFHLEGKHQPQALVK